MPSNAKIRPRCRSHGIRQPPLVPCAVTYNLDGTMPGSPQKVDYIRFEYRFITILYSVYLRETKMVNRINWENQDGKRLTSFYRISRHHRHGADDKPLSNRSQLSWDFVYPALQFIILSLLLMHRMDIKLLNHPMQLFTEGFWE